MEQYLSHFGIPGQRWGKRKYQYTDGSLTPEGRKHYGVGPLKGSGEKIQNGNGGQAKGSRNSGSSPSPSKTKAQIKQEKRERQKLIAQKKKEHAAARKAELRERKKAAEALKKIKKIEEAKKKWSKDPGQVRRHMKYFSTEELETLNRRFDAEDKIYKRSLGRLSKGSDYINTFVKFGKSLSSVDDLMGKPIKSKVKKYVMKNYGIDLDFKTGDDKGDKKKD